MESGATYSIGLKVIWLSGNNMLSTTIDILMKKKITHGVPQGSILGPFSSLYILMTFLNNLIYWFQCYFQMTQVCSLRELHLAVSIKDMHRELEKVDKWQKSNKLTINILKNSLYDVPSYTNQKQNSSRQECTFVGKP